METMTINPVTTTLLSGLSVNDEDSYTKKSCGTSAVSSHANMTKLRLGNFFRELTDLVIIDNTYRGILS